MFLHILGRQPALGVAELEALYGAEAVHSFGNAAIVSVDRQDFLRLGGTVKAGQIIAEYSGKQDILRELSDVIVQEIRKLPEDGKIKLGVSLYGFPIRPQKINAFMLETKKTIKKTGRSVRIVPNQEAELSSAQVLHNKLTDEMGIELVAFYANNKIVIARTVYVQNIDSYAFRDRSRPMRDARVGMLPPKLAQIIINLAAGKPNVTAETTVLDPFCGTGVLLQEALLMGFSAYGSDLSERMIEYSEKNLEWLKTTREYASTRRASTNQTIQLETGDASNHIWKPLPYCIAAETFLGKPLNEIPAPHILQSIIKECDDLHRAFLKNIATQWPADARFCLAVPAWRHKNGFYHLPVIDDLASLGYNRIDFTRVRNDDLVYHRDGQVVARELLVITKR